MNDVPDSGVRPRPLRLQAMTTPNFRTFDLNLLRIFDEVMAERSLTRAARNLAMTQPAVSNAMRRLRETLGDELMRRSGQGVEPTLGLPDRLEQLGSGLVVANGAKIIRPIFITTALALAASLLWKSFAGN